MTARKRSKAIASSDSESESESDMPNTTESVSKRPRKATSKAAAAAEEEKAKKKLAEYRKLKSQVKALKKQLNEQQSADNDEQDNVPSDPDHIPPESEEENEVTLGLAASIRRISTVTTKPTGQSPLLAPLPPPVPSRSDSAPASQAATTRSTSGTPAPTAANVSAASPPAPFRGGVAPPSGARPKAEDYVDEVKELLLDSIKHFSCYIYTKNAFPSDTQQDTFATDAWKAACNAREDSSAVYELSDRMKRIIWARKSNARGDVSDEVRSHTASAYGFRDGATSSNQRHNVALYSKLIKDGAFHHKTINEATGKAEGFAGHSYISRVIRLAFFGHGNTRTAIGFRFPDAFNPIPTQTVALVLTVVRAHIEEWSTGRHSAIHFSESEFAGTYKGLLEDLKGWVEGKEDVWLNIRKKWYRRAFTAGGGVMAEAGHSRVSRSVLDSAREELEGRTGLTDSENEGADGGEGSL
ncbi:hypothetical protein GSI_06785 [Ganoderma sinense ZZ0214-1]|uniref:DUF6532 domain-containing protein n=1 Tax=Ganoderma sinense ZZ0214-1 TaxID=1077348 RepID=A0A2G8SE80_9APHY|nr:hypothetical protein GSI_06785 [Ganoderma sinense ZZ0214-1]